ncbi:MAG TPA: cyclophilin-like fold protein [Gemmatimonadales bacterium]|nr:cyclophilin-like fold protein [Gemmatimonadales bacterium]
MKTLAATVMSLALLVTYEQPRGHPMTQRDAFSSTPANVVKLRIRVADRTMTATLFESRTSRDFVSLLPLTVTMNDLFRREKFGHLPRAISRGGKSTHTYTVGDIAYWPPGPDVAVYYRHDGEEIPDPGIIVIGRIDSSVEAFDVPGSVRVTFELLDKAAQGPPGSG